MKIYAFKVARTEKNVPKLAELLEKIKSEHNIEKRIKIINKSQIRVDEIKEMDGFWLLDFTKDRKNGGPGKASKKSKVQGFSFTAGEFFAEETAALYIPKTNYILIQSNQSGVLWQSIERYFSEFCEDGNINAYKFSYKLDEDFERRFRSKTIIRKVSFGIDLSKVKKEDREQGEALGRAVNFGRSFGDHQLKIEMSVGRNQKARLSNVLDFVKQVGLLSKKNIDAVTELEVTGRDKEDSPSETIDLIAQRLVVDIDIKPDLTDMRLSLDARWEALEQAKNGWNNVLK